MYVSLEHAVQNFHIKVIFLVAFIGMVVYKLNERERSMKTITLPVNYVLDFVGIQLKITSFYRQQQQLWPRRHSIMNKSCWCTADIELEILQYASVICYAGWRSGRDRDSDRRSSIYTFHIGLWWLCRHFHMMYVIICHKFIELSRFEARSSIRRSSIWFTLKFEIILK